MVFLSKTDNLILIVRDTHIMKIQLERDSAEHHLISTCQNCQDHQIHVSDGCMMHRSLPPPTKILGIYIEALMGFSHIYYPDGLTTTSLSQGCMLETASAIRLGAEWTFPGQGRVRSL